MKKSTFITSFTFSLLMLLSTNLTAQEFSGLDKSPMDVASFPSSYKIPQKSVKIVYSRPQLNGRSLSDLVPNGKQWRTGANEATEITFYKDMTVAGKPIKKGTYTLSTFPGEKDWEIIFSNDLNVWGSYFYNKDHDEARVIVPVTTSDVSLEAFSITFTEDGTMHMGWGKMRVAIPMK